MADETTFVQIKVNGTALEWQGEHPSDFDAALKPYAPCFPIVSTRFSMDRPMRAGAAVGGTVNGHPISITLEWDKNGPTIAQACHEGSPVELTIFSIVSATGEEKYKVSLEIKLEEGRVSDVSIDPSSHGSPTYYTFTTSYITTTIADPKGGTKTMFKQSKSTSA
jgi:type VI protein secretion system component Hcp